MVFRIYLFIKLQKQKSDHDVHRPESNVNSDKLAEYRSKWTSDSPASRDMRFQTESRRATTNMPIRYQTASVRMLPGNHYLNIV